MMGFYSYPGGRIFLGHASVKMMIYYAFDVDRSHISGGPAWADEDSFDVVALPPESSESRKAAQPPIKATPSDEQRKMLQSLLVERFGLHFHRAIKEEPVYLLVRGHNDFQMQEPAHPDADPRGSVMIKPGGIIDGEAFGINISMPLLARQLSRLLDRPVVDQTGLTASYDFHLPPSDPSNQDLPSAVFSTMKKLGLELKPGKALVESIVIDSVAKPTPN
jgi:uncharacterized protein (TIGR03435 family)